MQTVEEKNNVLMKNNMIIKAKYSINTVENRIFQLILYKMQKEKNNDTLQCVIKYEEFKQIIKRKNDRTIQAISDMLEELRIGKLEIKTNQKWLRYGFINGATYDAENQEFLIKADADIYKMLFNYLKGYTPVNLQIFFSFQNSYSQRVYELLKLWSNTKTLVNYTINELRELLKLENKYSLYGDFKKRVINPAIQELNKKGLMKIEIKENKINRKVVSIDFIVTDNDKRIYFQNKKDDTYINANAPEDKQKKYNKHKELKFKNFDERTYDYKSLERKLLGWDDDDKE